MMHSVTRANRVDLTLSGCTVTLAIVRGNQPVANPTATLVAGLEAWMEQRGFASLEQMRGVLSQKRVADPSAFARANYIRMLESWKNPYTLSGI